MIWYVVAFITTAEFSALSKMDMQFDNVDTCKGFVRRNGKVITDDLSRLWPTAIKFSVSCNTPEEIKIMINEINQRNQGANL